MLLMPDRWLPLAFFPAYDYGSKPGAPNPGRLTSEAVYSCLFYSVYYRWSTRDPQTYIVALWNGVLLILPAAQVLHGTTDSGASTLASLERGPILKEAGEKGTNVS